MSRTISRGYLLPSPGCFNTSEWRVTPSGREPLADPERIDGWDYATDLLIERTLSVDLESVRTEAGLHSRDQLRCVIQWTSPAETSTGLQGSSPVKILTEGRQDISCLITGFEIGGVLQLRTTVSLAIGSSDARNPLAARRSGSILWSDEHHLILEGEATRFPTELLSFSANGLGPTGCAWRVMVETADLDAPALSAVRVLINSDHPAYERLTEKPDSAEAALTREFLQYDVARQLVLAALAEDELKAVDYEQGSIGAILRARLMTYFSAEGRDIAPLRQRWRLDPGEIDAELQPFFLTGNVDG